MNITSPPFKDLDENENRKEDILTWKEIYEKLGIKTWNSRTEDAESEDILFSKFDKCWVDKIEYSNGEIKESRRYSRDISKNFNIIFDYLSEFGYEIDKDFYSSKRYSKLSCEYRFIGDKLPYISIDFNPFHNNLFKISISYHDSSHYDIKDYKRIIYNSLYNYAKKENNITLLRHFKIIEIFN